jgi:hypothetical protein
MRRLVALALLAATAAAPAASAVSGPPPLPCDYWVHGCNVPAYVYDACDRYTTLDCRVVV